MSTTGFDSCSVRELGQCGVYERHVEPDVVTDDHGFSDRLYEPGEHLGDCPGLPSRVSSSIPVSSLTGDGIGIPGSISEW